MRVLLLAVTLLFSAGAMAQPKYLEGATVTVTLKNGKKYVYKSSEMAVVKRANLHVNNGEVKEAKKIVKSVKEGKLIKNRKNRAYFIAGYGPTGKQKSSTNGSTYEVKQEHSGVIGVGYQRKVTDRVSVGGQIQTNGTTSVSIGTDF